MDKTILPEGRLLETGENQRLCASLQGLREAMWEGVILEGLALQCQEEEGLEVALGPFRGFLPWSQAALGLAEGLLRPIAVMSRVGRPISVRVTELREEEGEIVPILSRTLAQESARDQLLRLPLGTVVPATVTRLETFGVFVDLGCGVASLLSIDRISISRISHPSQRFWVGQEIYVAILERDLALGRVRVSHRELMGTWADNAEKFAVGTTLPGLVRSVKPYGIFVELLPNFSGLAEYVPGYGPGDRVSVYIKGLVPEKMKCKLLIIGRLPLAPLEAPSYHLPSTGRLLRWDYAQGQIGKPGSETVFAEEGEHLGEI